MSKVKQPLYLADVNNLKNNFPGIVHDATTLMGHNYRNQKFRIELLCGGYMLCEEQGKSNLVLETYYYNWHNDDGTLVIKFHNHYHPPATPNSISQFDPLHIQSPDSLTDFHGNVYNHSPFQSLDDILDYLITFTIINRWKK